MEKKHFFLVTISRYNGTIHGFVGLIELGNQALTQAAAALRVAFNLNTATNTDPKVVSNS